MLALTYTLPIPNPSPDEITRSIKFVLGTNIGASSTESIPNLFQGTEFVPGTNLGGLSIESTPNLFREQI